MNSNSSVVCCCTCCDDGDVSGLDALLQLVCTLRVEGQLPLRRHFVDQEIANQLGHVELTGLLASAYNGGFESDKSVRMLRRDLLREFEGFKEFFKHSEAQWIFLELG